MSIETLLIIISAILFLVTGASLYLWWDLRYRQRRINRELPPSDRPPVSRIVKCHVKTFTYADGAKITKHSFCDGVGLSGLTDAAASNFHPESPLTAVHNATHGVRAS